MDYRLKFEPMIRRVAAKLNPCRWCGGRADVRRITMDWGYEDTLWVGCQMNHEPVHLMGCLFHDGDLPRYYKRLLDTLGTLVELWNERHDGPGFMAGLA